MIYIIKAHAKRKETKRLAAALETLLDTYEARCRTLQENTQRILHTLEKDAPNDTTP